MALNETELRIRQKVKDQWGTASDFNQVLSEFRRRQPTETTEITEAPEEAEISGLDIWVKAGKALSSIWETIKLEWQEFPETPLDVAKVAGTFGVNLPGDAVEWVWEIIELVSDPVWTGEALKVTAGGLIEKGLNEIFSTKIGQDILRKLWAPEGNLEQIKDWGFFTDEIKKEAANAAIQQLKDNFWDLDKATKSITENPVDTILFVKWMIIASKKLVWKGKAAKLDKLDKSLSQKLKESAGKDVEQALGATKEKFKQKSRDISWEVIEKGIKWSREEIQLIAEQKAADFWTQIGEFIESWKLKGTVKRDKLLEVLDDIRKEGQVGDVILDESIISATDKMADAISGFGKEIPAEKARIIRQMFDDAVYSTKGVISEEALSLKNNIKKGLADSIRKQLAEQNPDLAKLNKEFSFYSKLDEVLTETINRTWPQQGGLTGGITSAGGLWAGAVIFGDVTGAIATAAVAKWLASALKSPRWKLTKASTKNKLADALASWDKKLSNKLASDIIKEVLQNKANIFLWAQVWESNLDDNK